ncbi:unnamed protein product [Urochloa humidicola]
MNRLPVHISLLPALLLPDAGDASPAPFLPAPEQRRRGRPATPPPHAPPLAAGLGSRSRSSPWPTSICVGRSSLGGCARAAGAGSWRGASPPPEHGAELDPSPAGGSTIPDRPRHALRGCLPRGAHLGQGWNRGEASAGHSGAAARWRRNGGGPLYLRRARGRPISLPQISVAGDRTRSRGGGATSDGHRPLPDNIPAAAEEQKTRPGLGRRGGWARRALSCASGTPCLGRCARGQRRRHASPAVAPLLSSAGRQLPG